MWFTPGMVLAGIFVYVVYLTTGSAAHWWLWIVAVLGAIIIDAFMGYERKKVPRTKTQTVYRKKD